MLGCQAIVLPSTEQTVDCFRVGLTFLRVGCIFPALLSGVSASLTTIIAALAVSTAVSVMFCSAVILSHF